MDAGVLASSTFGASVLAGSAWAIAAVGASAFTSSDFVSELASTFAPPGLSSAFVAETSVFVSSLASAALAAGSDFGASALASAFDVSLAGWDPGGGGGVAGMGTTGF